jgi:hypothetical protein
LNRAPASEVLIISSSGTTRLTGIDGSAAAAAARTPGTSERASRSPRTITVIDGEGICANGSEISLKSIS